jgi:light-regulated signal transduction histidine kinase (bacteriophytochrome)
MLERELESMAERIATLEREKGQLEAFTAVTAHELIEPLVTTEAYASIITERLQGSEHERTRADLKVLALSMSRLRQLAESVLKEARSDSRPIRRRPVAVDRLVADLLALLSPHITARESNVAVDELPEAVADEVLLSRVFSNLLINALKYSPRQGATIRIGGSAEPSRTRYFVESEGTVLSAVDRSSIFNDFKRGRDERRAAGSGLGLSICRRIVIRHGGEIGVEPVGSTGNRFYFTLPR